MDSILGINIVENKCIKYLVQKMWTKIVDSILDINTVNKKNITFNSGYENCRQNI